MRIQIDPWTALNLLVARASRACFEGNGGGGNDGGDGGFGGGGFTDAGIGGWGEATATGPGPAPSDAPSADTGAQGAYTDTSAHEATHDEPSIEAGPVGPSAETGGGTVPGSPASPSGGGAAPTTGADPGLSSMDQTGGFSLGTFGFPDAPPTGGFTSPQAPQSFTEIVSAFGEPMAAPSWGEEDDQQPLSGGFFPTQATMARNAAAPASDIPDVDTFDPGSDLAQASARTQAMLDAGIARQNATMTRLGITDPNMIPTDQMWATSPIHNYDPGRAIAERITGAIAGSALGGPAGAMARGDGPGVMGSILGQTPFGTVTGLLSTGLDVAQMTGVVGRGEASRFGTGSMPQTTGPSLISDIGALLNGTTPTNLPDSYAQRGPMGPPTIGGYLGTGTDRLSLDGAYNPELSPTYGVPSADLLAAAMEAFNGMGSPTANVGEAPGTGGTQGGSEAPGTEASMFTPGADQVPAGVQQYNALLDEINPNQDLGQLVSTGQLSEFGKLIRLFPGAGGGYFGEEEQDNRSAFGNVARNLLRAAA